MPIFCLNDSIKYFLCTDHADIKKGVFTLCSLVHERSETTPEVGTLFIFYNRFQTKIKLLHTKLGGLILYEKLLGERTFNIPIYAPVTRSSSMTWSDLVNHGGKYQ